MSDDPRRVSPSAARNRDAIRDVLVARLPATGLLVEVASGSGEHAVHFAAALPGLAIQPSDIDPQARASIDAWAAASGLAAIRPALALDATAETWPLGAADVVLSLNMIHIAPWAAAIGLVRHTTRLLGPGGLLVLYGPFLRDGVPTAAGNLAFDADLRARDPAWGLRRMEAVQALATGFDPPEVVAMPANNLTLLFRRR